jgi:hypothetical protein
MASLERQRARQRGRRAVDAMRRRRGQLRKRVAATAIVCFVLLWTVVFVQMATGNDPVLARNPATRAAAKERASSPPPLGPRAAVPPPCAEEDQGGGATPVEEVIAPEPEELEPVVTGQS